MLSPAVISSSSFMLHAGSRPLLPHDSASPLLRVRMDYRDNNYRSGVDNSGAWSSLDKNLGEPEGLVARFIWKGPGMSLMYYMEEMQELWAKADTDGDGYLSTADTINLMQSCEKEYSEEQANTRARSPHAAHAAAPRAPPIAAVPCSSSTCSVSIASARERLRCAQVLAMVADIEKVQGIERRDAEGGPLIFFQQWTKWMNDMAREEKKKKQ